MTAIKSIIVSEDLYFRYEPETEGGTSDYILKGIDLEIEEGSFVAVLGRNGCGKSTFAKHINAILVPTSGRVSVSGYDTADEDKIYLIRQSAGMVFQNPDNQIVATIVEDDVAFAPENLGLDPDEIRKRVDEALKAVGMEAYRLHSPSQLSGGQKQRVAIAGIIAMRPRCIILDEPTAMLDPQGRKEVMKTLAALREKYGITIVLITHYMEEAARCDRVIVMDDGRVSLDDAPEKVFSNVEYMRSAGLDVPQVTELSYELRKEGYELPAEILSEEACVEAILSLM